MANRDISVSICGVVIGILLGAGSVAYIQDMSLAANSADSISYFAPDGFEPPNKRFINRNFDGPTPRTKTIEKDSESEDPVQPVKKDLACEAAHDAANSLMVTFKKYVEENSKNTEDHLAFAATYNEVIAKHCPNGVAPKAAAPAEIKVKATKPVKVDNDCWQFGEGSARRAQCQGNENINKPYIN